MAITLEKVTLSQVDFKMLKYDETDISQFRAGYDLSFMPQSWQDLPAVQNFSLCNKMFIAGLTSMNLYDDDNNVIGSITAHNYRLVYITAQPFEDYGHYAGVSRQMSTSGYEPYYTDGTTRHYLGGVKYMAYVSMPNNSMYFTVTLNNETMTLSHDSYQGVYVQYITQVDDVYGAWNTTTFNDTIWRGDYLDSIGIVEATFGDVHGMYLTAVSIWPEGYWHPQGEQELFAYQSSTNILADNLSFTEHPIEEDGYVNELNKRFSPRVYSDMTGIYLVDMDMMQTKIVPALVDYGFDDFIADTRVTGGQGQNKECVQAIRWYYGIKDWIQKSDYDYDIVVGKNFLRYNSLPDSYIVTKYAKSEFCLWHTSPLSVPAHFNNYLDFVSSYKLYLPYFGFLDIEPNDIVGGTIQVFYGINLVTGHTNITVACKNSRTGNKDFKYYTVSCTVGEEIPFGTNLYKNMSLTLAMNVVDAAKFAINTGAKLYGAGASANFGQLSADTSATLSTNNAMINGAGESTLKTYANSSMEKATSNAGQIAATSKRNAYIQHANDVVQSIPNVPNVQRSSSFNSESGTMDELHPYLLITRPVNVEPADYEDYGGLPSSESVLLSNCNGFTQIRAAHPDTMTNAPKYIDEILAQLQAGVYL